MLESPALIPSIIRVFITVNSCSQRYAVSKLHVERATEGLRAAYRLIRQLLC